MKSSRKNLKTFLAAVVLSVFMAPRLFACASCGSGNGDMPSSPLTNGMNLGILTLFVVIATVLGSIAAFFVYLIRREAALAAKTATQNLSEAKA